MATMARSCGHTNSRRSTQARPANRGAGFFTPIGRKSPPKSRPQRLDLRQIDARPLVVLMHGAAGAAGRTTLLEHLIHGAADGTRESLPGRLVEDARRFARENPPD